MQVDLIITELNVGGAEQTLSRLAIGLQNLGDEVRVYSIGQLPKSDHRGNNRVVAELQECNISITSGEAMGTGSLPRVAWDLRRWLRQRPNAVRQSFLFHANVLTNQLDSTPTQKGRRFAGIRVAECRPVRLWLERTALRRANKIICVSSAVQAFAQRQFGGDPDRLVVIPNSVDVDRFASAQPVDFEMLGWPADAKIIVFVGRLHPQKNLELIQASLDEFAPPGENIRLLIIGDGPQRHAIQQWANSVPGDRVRLLPWQSDISPFVAACDALVLPSHYEGMPNVVMEAMAAAKPVVCSRVEGSVELIGDDAHQGFAPGDRQGMTERLNQFLNDSELAIAIGRQNQNRMREHFSVQRMVNAYHELYLNAN